MSVFEKWHQQFQHKSTHAPIHRKAGWFSALRWYQSVAEECEKDCHTDEDYRILYFHLKQVLENEMSEILNETIKCDYSRQSTL